MLNTTSKKTKILLFLLAVIIITPVFIGLLHEGFPLTDDGSWMVIRFSAFYENIRAGQFPVRFLTRLNNGYGYPVADFLYPLFMYIGVPIKAIGFSFVNTIKIIMAGSIIFSGIFTFLWLRKLFTSIASFIGAICYMYFPYHLFDLHQRGSIGELLALAVVPFILWGIEKRNLALQALGFALLITSHNTLALLFVPVILGYKFISHKEGNQGINFFASIILGLGISAFFWIPALYDRQFTVFDNIKISEFSNYFVTFKNMNLYGVIFLISIACGFFAIHKKKNLRVVYFLILSFLTLLMTTSISSSIWNLFFISNLIQFPFRFVSFAVLSSSFLVAYFLNLFKGKILFIYAILISIAIFFSSADFIYPKSFQYLPDTFYSTNQDTTTVKNEYMPKWVERLPSENESKIEVVSGDAEIANVEINGDKIRFNLVSQEKSTIQINNVYFPGWKVMLGSEFTGISYKDNGLIRFTTGKGKYLVKAGFYETPIRVVSDIISLSSILLISYLILSRKYNT